MNDSIKKSEDKKKQDDLLPKEIGGPKGLEPTRYGAVAPEWEVKGRVSDF